MSTRLCHVTITFKSEKPQITEWADGYQRVIINNLGSDVTPGAAGTGGGVIFTGPDVFISPHAG